MLCAKVSACLAEEQTTQPISLSSGYVFFKRVLGNLQTLTGLLERFERARKALGYVQYRNICKRSAKFPIFSTRLLRNVCRLFRY